VVTVGGGSVFVYKRGQFSIDIYTTQYYLRLTSDLYPEVVRRSEAEFGYVIPEWEVVYDES